jgi:hypothetical protein
MKPLGFILFILGCLITVAAFYQSLWLIVPGAFLGCLGLYLNIYGHFPWANKRVGS